MTSFLKRFSKSQATAFAATIVDFGTLTLLVEVFHVYYVIAVACGAFLGALTNFSLNHHWAFVDGRKSTRAQAWRYALVSGGSMLLNTGLVFCLTSLVGVQYLVSKLIVSLAVSWFYNYPLHRYFVWPALAKKENQETLNGSTHV